MVTLSDDLFAVPDGELYPKLFRKGEIVDGAVAQAAIDQGKAEAGEERPKRGRPAKKAMSAPENK